jgi:5'-nucleotidase
MRRAVVALAVSACLWATSATSTPAQTRSPRVVSVQILAINDFHGALEPPTGTNGLIGDVTAGGAAYLARHLAQATAANPNSIIVGAGDLIGASPLLSSLARNEPAVAALNAMHLAISAVGNHEFDRGWRELLRMQQGGCHPTDGCEPGRPFRGASFQYLAANVVRRTDHGDVPLLPATAVRTLGGVKVGFIGETLRDTPKMLSAAGSKDLTFLDEADAANRAVAELRKQHVNAIVLLIHEGGRQAAEDRNARPNSCDGFSGDLLPVVRRLSPDIKVVLSAHTHRAYNCTIDGRTVTSAASFGRLVTRVTLSIDAWTDTITSVAATNEIVTRDVQPDPAQLELIAHYASLAVPIARRAVGSIAAPLPRALNSAGESVLGDVIADAQLSAAQTLAGGADVAFMNEGGIRADLPSGPVSYNDLFAVHPFGNTVLAMNIDGRTLKDLLEQQFDNPTPGRRDLLQVSAGFTYRYALNAPAGQHVDAASIVLNGKVVRPDDRLRIAASDFLHTGGGGFTVFARGSDILSAGVDVDALETYVRAHSPIQPPAPTRIVRVD